MSFYTLLLKSFLSIVFLVGNSSCIFKKNIALHKPIEKHNISLFIAMPKSSVTFENIAPRLQATLSSHFKKVGYHIAQAPSLGYRLVTNVQRLGPTYSYVSPDILLFHSMVELVLMCELRDFNNSVVAKKSFSFSCLLSNARNPIMRSHFMSHKYQQLMQQAGPKIEQYFRPFLLGKFS